MRASTMDDTTSRILAVQKDADAAHEHAHDGVDRV
jgi:hypothetical protein